MQPLLSCLIWIYFEWLHPEPTNDAHTIKGHRTMYNQYRIKFARTVVRFIQCVLFRSFFTYATTCCYQDAKQNCKGLLKKSNKVREQRKNQKNRTRSPSYWDFKNLFIRLLSWKNLNLLYWAGKQEDGSWFHKWPVRTRKLCERPWVRVRSM